MSETLTESAPAVSEEAPPVGSDALPEASSEVETGSDSSGFDPSQWVSVDRFNGLMSSLSKKDNELKTAMDRLSELETRLNQQPASQQETSLSEVSALEQQVAALTQMLQSERLEKAKAEALAKHPEAAPFADLIVASSPEDFEEMAAAIATRMKGTSPAPEATGTPAEEPAAGAPEAPAAPAAEAAPEAPVVGGGVPFVGSESVRERVTEAIKKRSFTDYLKAKWEATVEDNPDLQLETD